MNKILIAIVLAVLIGGGVYYYNSNNSTDSTTEETKETSDDTGGSRTLKDLLGAGKNQVCTFSTDAVSSGKVYMAGEKIRGDFTIVADGETMTTSMIQDGEWMYYWGSAMPQGVKMQFNLEEAAADYEATSPTSVSQAVDMNAQMNFDCDSWRVDNSVFELPAGVEFVDLSVQTQQMMDGIQY